MEKEIIEFEAPQDENFIYMQYFIVDEHGEFFDEYFNNLAQAEEACKRIARDNKSKIFHIFKVVKAFMYEPNY